MAFTSRRGRPSLKLVEGGKKEAISAPKIPHKVFKVAREPLDICLAKDLITPAQHWAGVHFRWLYTVRFGSPDISASNLEIYYGRDTRKTDETWQQCREREYAMAIESLRKSGSLKIVMNLAVFNHLPRFLTGMKGHQRMQMEQNYRELSKLREGLDILSAVWDIKV